ncbi:hypothetical protein MTO96_005964 [Rhipicephalus appendiculatus]
MMAACELKPVCSWSNVSTLSWQNADVDDSWWNTGAIGAFADYLQHFKLQDEVVPARRANSKQAVWKALLLGYALVIIAARITTLTLSRRLVVPTVLLLVITIPVASPYLQSLSSQTLVMAIVVAILEVACVRRQGLLQRNRSTTLLPIHNAVEYKALSRSGHEKNASSTPT